MNRRIAFAALSLVLAAPLFADPEKVSLVFAPKAGQAYVVKYVADQKWDYKEEDMKGEMHVELTLRWTFEKKKGALDGSATYDKVVYRAKGTKKGHDFDDDIEWTAAGGYAKGEGCESDRNFCAAEIKEGLKLTIAGDATCQQGEC